jgi:hypothetical protein
MVMLLGAKLKEQSFLHLLCFSCSESAKDPYSSLQRVRARNKGAIIYFKMGLNRTCSALLRPWSYSASKTGRGQARHPSRQISLLTNPKIQTQLRRIKLNEWVAICSCIARGILRLRDGYTALGSVDFDSYILRMRRSC